LFNIKQDLFARPSLCFVSGKQRNGVKDTSLPGGSGYCRTCARRDRRTGEALDIIWASLLKCRSRLAFEGAMMDFH
jgi:hypothetical protein